MNSISPNIPTDLPSLAWLKDLSLHDLCGFLLKRLALIFPRGRTFNLYHLYSPGSLCRSDGYGCFRGDPNSEVLIRIRYLLNTPWEEMVRDGYITELPRGREWYERRFEITAKGWEFVDSMTLDSQTLEVDDDSIDIIRTQAPYRMAKSPVRASDSEQQGDNTRSSIKKN